MQPCNRKSENEEQRKRREKRLRCCHDGAGPCLLQKVS